MRTITRSQVRLVDRTAIEQLGIPGVVLMENAGINAAVAIINVLGNVCRVPLHEARVVVLCGGGNNGGDGYVIARHMHNWGAAVDIYSVQDPDGLSGDAAVNYGICRNMGLPIHKVTDSSALDKHAPDWAQGDILVDALLGTGFEGQVRPHLAAAIERVNRLDGPFVLCVDIPSGLDCDSGCPSNATVRGDMTVSFVAAKAGFSHEQAGEYVGQIKVADIGVPPELIDRVLSGRSSSHI